MATEYKLSYTGSEINEKLAKVDTLPTSGDVDVKVSEHNSDATAHNDIRTLTNEAKTLAEDASTLAATANTAASNASSAANAAMPKSGGDFTGAVTAQNNANHTTKQVRNIALMAEGAGTPSTGNGDIILTYTP